MRRHAFLIVFVSALFILATGCQQAPEPSKPGKKSPPTHWVVTENTSNNQLSSKIQSTGTLRANQSIEIFIQEEGQITYLPYFEGDTIKKGDVVARLDDRLLLAELKRAVALREQIEKDLSRLKALSAKQLTSVETLGSKETELAVAIADENVLKTRVGFTQIRSPIDGTVVGRHAETGKTAQKHTHISTIADLATLIIDVSVSELLFPKIALGDQVSVFVDALGKSITGKVSRKHPNIDPETRRGIVEISLEAPPENAQPGQFCRVTFETLLSNALSVPFRAIQYDNQGPYVYLFNGQPDSASQDQGVVSKVSVKTGQRFGDRIEVIEGLSPNSRLITRGFLDLKAGDQVTEANLSESRASESR